MNTLISIIIFGLGLVLGSFLNVVGYRLSIGQKINNPKRSYCSSCNKSLGFFDLIPVISFVFNKGKCRYCKNKISFFYPVSEILCGILYLTSYNVFGLSYQFIVGIIISSLLIMVITSDINFLIIPDEITLAISIILILTSFVFEGINPTLIKLFYGILMFGFMYLLMLFGNYIFKKETLGGADIKLMFVIGFVVGPISSLFAIFLASLIALPVSLSLLVLNKENIIPYGPFLVLALLFIHFFSLNTDKLISIFSLV